MVPVLSIHAGCVWDKNQKKKLRIPFDETPQAVVQNLFSGSHAMPIYVAFLVALGATVLLRCYVTPRLDAAWMANRSLEKFAKARVVAAFKAAQELATVAMLVLGIASFVLLTVNLIFHGTTVAEVESLRSKFIAADTWLTNVEKDFFFASALPCGIAIAVLVILGYRTQLASYRAWVGDKVAEQWPKYLEARKQGTLEPEQDTASMTELLKEIARCDASLDALASLPTTGLTETQTLSEKRRAELESEREEFVRQYLQQDFIRRVDLSDDSSPSPIGDRRGWLNGLLSFIVSEGFARDRKALGTVLKWLATTGLVVSFIGVSAPVVHSALTDASARLNSLELKLSKDEAEKSFDAALEQRKDEGQKILTESDHQMLAQIAVLYRQALIVRFSRAIMPATSQGTHLDQAITREHVLKALYPLSSTSHDAHEVLVVGSVVHPGDANSDATVALAFFDDATPRADPLVEHALTHDVAPHSAAVMDALRGKFATFVEAHGRPAKASDSVEALFDAFLDAVLDHAVPEAKDSWVISKVRSTITDTAKEQLKDVLGAVSKTFLRDLLGSATLQEALSRVRDEPLPELSSSTSEALREFAAQAQSGIEDAVGVVDKYPAALRSAETPMHTDEAVIKLVQRSIGSSIDDLQSHEDWRAMTAFAATYEDYFPSQMRSEDETQQAHLIQAIARNFKGGDDGMAPPSANPPSPGGGPPSGGGHDSGFAPVAESRPTQEFFERDFVRARSYASLRAFSRVGGVLFGDGPSGKEGAVDVRSFDWIIANEQVRFVLRVGNQTLVKGPFRLQIVRQALAFAADGRPVAVTMPSAEPVPGRKTVVHPALNDTAMGCRLAQLDTLADLSMSRDKHVHDVLEAQMQTISQLNDAYRVATAARWDAWLANADRRAPQMNEQSRAVISELRRAYLPAIARMKSTLASQPPLDTAAWDALPIQADTPFSQKHEFFDAELLETMTACHDEHADSMNDLYACVRQKYDGVAVNTETYRRVMADAPSYQEESGVRDAPYSLDSELAWMRDADATGEQTPSTLRFMREIQFTTPPHFNDGKETEAWEFRQTSEANDRAVRLLAARNENIGGILRDAEEFNSLQRFFRLALNGSLGAAFPLARLQEFAAQISGVQVTAFQLPIWNVPTSDEFAEAVSQKTSSLQALVSSMERQGFNTSLGNAVREDAGACDANTHRAAANAKFESATSVQGVCEFADVRSDLAKQCQTDESNGVSLSMSCRVLAAAEEIDRIAADMALTMWADSKPVALPVDRQYHMVLCPEIG